MKEAIEKLKTTLTTSDTDVIKADSEALEQAFYKLSEKLYAQNGGAQGAPGYDAGAEGGTEGQGYYNADFEDKTDN